MHGRERAERVDDLADLIPYADADTTPRRVFRPAVAAARLDRVAAACRAIAQPPLVVQPAFSVKTNPRAELLAAARERGFLAETISREELRWALRLGFSADRVVHNGPEPLDGSGVTPAYAFADSVEAFVRERERRAARVVGVRLRPSMVRSRFGVPVDDDAALHAAVRSGAPREPVGVSFHARREDFHVTPWRDVAGDVIARAAALEAETGCSVRVVDLGGGWTPEEFDATFASDVRSAVEQIAARLGSCMTVLVEPGQAVCTPVEALVVRVLEVRRRGARIEAIVDAGYPELPQMHAYVHGFFAWRDGAWEALGHGPDRLGGRTCLEYDLIDGLRFPPDLREGDRLLITGAGSYDHSMAFRFADGRETPDVDGEASGGTFPVSARTGTR